MSFWKSTTRAACCVKLCSSPASTLLPRSTCRNIHHTSRSPVRLVQSSCTQHSLPRFRYTFPKRSTYSTVVVHNKGRARGRRIISFLLISTTSFVVGSYVALTYAPPFLTPLVLGTTPTDEQTLSMYNPPDEISKEVDDYIKNHPLTVSLRNNPDFRESRPHMKIPEAIRQHSLTGGTLAGPGMMVVPPFFFNEKDGKSMVQIFYVGTDLSGHPGLVHGGFLATMLDEGLARCAFEAMPNKMGVTANLQINYRKPTKAGQFLVLKARTTKVEGRKGWSEGWIEALDTPEGKEPEKLVEASGLFIEPRHAKYLKSLYRNAT